MRHFTRRDTLSLTVGACLALRAGVTPAQAPRSVSAASPPPANTDWRHFAADNANTRYAPLDQINASNFNELEVAWRFQTSPFGPSPEFVLQSTPLVIDGRMFFTAGSRRSVVAIDATTAEVLWVHREDEGARALRAPRRLSGRGVSYWTDGTEERILYVTIGYQLVALDAKTGARVPGFGKDGMVDLKQDDDQELDLVNADVGLHATPQIAKNVVIVGAAHMAGNEPRVMAPKGYVRGFDVRTGKRLWIFHTIPRRGEFGYDTWLDGTENVGNAGVWSEVSIDPELGLAYLPVELPSGDATGQLRRGPGLFGESIVAVDLETGVRRWHYQMVHHGLWDYDVPCAPILCDIPVAGQIVKALAQPTKQAFLYVLNRETGKPIWPIPEKRVPRGVVPGEWYSPTQPVPSKPPAFDRQGFSEATLIDFTPELHAEAVRLMKNYKIGPMFTPPSVFEKDGTWGTLTLPNLVGGANWPGGSYDPETYTVFIYTNTQADVTMSVHNTDPKRSVLEWVNMRSDPARRLGQTPIERDGFRPGVLTVQGLPLIKPPYGSIVAVDLARGAIAWSVPHGDTPDEVRNHPALKGLTIPKTGQNGRVGTTSTKSLVLCGDPIVTTQPNGTRSAMLRAYDKRTGAQVGAIPLPGPQSGCPMTFMNNGRQYLVLAVGGGAIRSELVAFRLPRA